MVSSAIIAKSCYNISNVSCYEIVKDFSSPLLTALALMASVFIAFKKLSEQHKNTLAAQNEESKRNTKIELFKDINTTLEHSKVSIQQVSSYCSRKQFSSPNLKAPLDNVEYLELVNNFNNAIMTVITKVESHEVVNPKLFRVFRFALQSILHDLLELQSESDRLKVTEAVIKLANDSIMYFYDFQICMQNWAYGEIFNADVPYRKPANKKIKVITNCSKNLDDLHHYFLQETKWGKTCQKYESEAKEKYSSS